MRRNVPDLFWQAVSAPPAETTPPPKVLVVDDEEIVRRFLTLFLSRAGYHVETAQDGEAALELFQKHSWDLVMTDQIMPGMKGEEMAATMREQAPDLPIILMTGFAQEVAAPELFIAVLHKPFKQESLLACVNAALKIVT